MSYLSNVSLETNTVREAYELKDSCSIHIKFWSNYYKTGCISQQGSNDASRNVLGFLSSNELSMYCTSS